MPALSTVCATALSTAYALLLGLGMATPLLANEPATLPAIKGAAGQGGTYQGNYLHEVKPGDTLWGISKQYFQQPLVWPALGQTNSVKVPRLIYPGQILVLGAPNFTHGVTVIAASGTVWAELPHVASGRTSPANPATNPATNFAANTATITMPSTAIPVKKGDALPVGVTLHTAQNSFVTMELPDGSRTSLPSLSSVVVEQTVNAQGNNAVVLRLERGDLEARVPPKVAAQVANSPKSPAAGSAAAKSGAKSGAKSDAKSNLSSSSPSPFQVRTRMASVGVRGTRFRVSLPLLEAIETSRAESAESAGTTAVGVLESVVQVQPLGMQMGQHRVKNGMQNATNAASVVLTESQAVLAGRSPLSGVVQDMLPAPQWANAGRAQMQGAVALGWSAVRGAASYRVQLARDADFVDVVTERRLPAAAASGCCWTMWRRGIGFARVSALTYEGVEGLPARQRFSYRPWKIDGLKAEPSASSGGVAVGGAGGEWVLAWSAPDGVLEGVTYTLEIANDANFSQTAVVIRGLANPQTRVAALPPGVYWWRVHGEMFVNGQRTKTLSEAKELLVAGAR